MFSPRPVAAALIVAVLGSAGCAGQPPNPTYDDPAADPVRAAAVRGQQFAARGCSGCHAIGSAGASPLAAATPFREIVHRYPLDQLEARFAAGLVTSHPTMPPFTFRASEIDDLMAYLETVKAAS